MDVIKFLKSFRSTSVSQLSKGMQFSESIQFSLISCLNESLFQFNTVSRGQCRICGIGLQTQVLNKNCDCE